MHDKNYECSITVFTSISLLLIIGLLFSLTEIARMKVSKLYMTVNCAEATDSLFSLYHRKLWDTYNLFGLESFDNNILKKEYLQFLNIPIKSDSEYYNNFFLADINDENININGELLTENNNIEDEIISYMNYGIIKSLIKFGSEKYDINSEYDKSKLLNDIEEKIEMKNNSNIYENLYDKYFNFKKEIIELEDCGREANENIEKYINKINYLRFSEAASESGLKNNKDDLNELYNYLNKSYNMLKNYMNKMVRLRDVISNNKNMYLIEKEVNRDIDANVDRFILDEFDIYESYVDENSDMNIKIRDGFENINNVKILIYDNYEILNNLYNDATCIKNDIKDIRKDKDLNSDEKSEEISELNESLDVIYEEAKNIGKYLNEIKYDFSLPALNINVSDKNSASKTNIFDKILDIKDDGLLALCLDKDRIDLFKNNINAYDNFQINSNCDPYKKFLLGEYDINFLNFYRKNDMGLDTKSKSNVLEIEYLLTGKNNDKDALVSITNRLILTREALNLIYIINNSEKKRQARLFVNALFAPCSIIVKETMYIVTISAWAFAQSVSDVSKLYDLYNVPFIHTDDTWDYDIDSILDLSREKVRAVNNDNNKGLNYKDYLRIYLFIDDQKLLNSRLCEIINYNLKTGQENFNLNNLIYGIDFENVFDCKHYFTNFIIFSPENTKLFNDYKMKINMHYDYIENNKK